MKINFHQNNSGVSPEASRQKKYWFKKIKSILTGLLQGPGYPLQVLRKVCLDKLNNQTLRRSFPLLSLTRPDENISAFEKQ